MQPRPARTLRGSRRFAAVFAATALVVAACGGDDDSADAPADAPATADEPAGDEPASADEPTGDVTGDSDESGEPADSGDGTSDTTAVPADDGSPQAGGILRVAHINVPSRLDPHLATSGFDHYLLYPMFDRLIDFDPSTMEPMPMLAESWEYVDDQTLVLQIREGVTFHDGTPLDGEAVKYNLERGLNHPDSAVSADLSSIESVELTDPMTVQLNLGQPDSALVLNLSDKGGMMVSPTAAEELGDDFLNQPVGAGPFAFAEYVTGESLSLDAYDGYWKDGLPYLDGMEFTIFADSRTAVNALVSGQADFDTTVDVPDAERIESEAGYQLIESKTLAMNRCYLRLGEGPFATKEVRQALNFGIDREGLNLVVNEGRGEPAQAPLPSDNWAYPSENVPVYDYDPEKAKQLLVDAGYADGIDIELIVVSGERDQAMVEAMQAMLQPTGMNLNVTVLDIAEASPAYRENGEGDIYCVGWSGRPDPYATFQAIYDPASVYVTDYEPPAGLMDALAATIATSDTEERAAAFAEVHQIATVENALDFIVAMRPGMQAHSDAVQGYVPNAYGKPIMNEVWLAGE